MTLTVGVIGIDHRHIFGQLENMQSRGCICKGWYTDGEPQPMDGFIKRFPDIPRVPDQQTLLQDPEIDMILISTFMLLFSSITYGFAMLKMQANQLRGTMVWLAITGLLGAGFLGLELYEFNHLIHEGAGPGRSGFLSAFFGLVGTHGLHVLFGIVWLVTLLFQLKKHGLIPENQRRLFCLSMFWHFLDVVWIGVFTFVYLMGVLP